MKSRIVLLLIVLFSYGSAQEIEDLNHTEYFVRVAGPEKWDHGDSGIVITWDSFDGAFFKVELWGRNGLVTTLTRGNWIEGEKVFCIEESINPDWGSGSDFRIRVVNDLGENAWSRTLQIASDVHVMKPDAWTCWSIGAEDAAIEWTGCQGDSVRCFLYKGGDPVCNLGGWSINSGDCTVFHRSSGIEPESGYITAGFRLVREVRVSTSGGSWQ